MSTITPADLRAALTRVAVAIRALLDGNSDPVLHHVSTRDLHRMRRALGDAGLFSSTVKNGQAGAGGKGGSRPTPISEGPDADITIAVTPTERSEVSTTRRTTWLTEYCDVYAAVYHEPPTPLTIKRMARTFKELEIKHPRLEVVRRFDLYVHTTPARFFSVEHFANTWPAWRTAMTASGKVDSREPLPGETTDEYLARQFPPSAR